MVLDMFGRLGRGVTGPVPIACSLGSGEAVTRAGEWREVMAEAHERRDVDGGVVAVFPMELAARVADLTVAEHRCCPFFEFTLRLGGDELRWEVHAPPEAEPMLTGLFACDAGRGES